MSGETVSPFWSLFSSTVSTDPTAPLSELDGALNQAINLISSNLVGCLSDEHSLHQAVSILLQSPLFQNHSQRATNLIILTLIDPDTPLSLIFVGCLTLLLNGFQHSVFFRTLRTFKMSNLDLFRSASQLTHHDPSTESSQLIPILLGIGTRVGLVPSSFMSSTSSQSYPNPIDTLGVSAIVLPGLSNERYAERKLGPLLSGLLYELCRVQKLETEILNLFSEQLIDNLFELVELTRDQEDETFNYNLIKLIIALNEQFMIASLQPQTSKKSEHSSRHHRRKSQHHSDLDSNVVIRTMKHRLNESKTFGENLIFILNRASHSTPEGLCVSLLILKILYLLFTTPGTHEYFYTNDLCVLVDIFVRELSDLPDESDDLRHTYLRVLHPLLTQTQLRSHPYKREEIRNVLLSHIKFAHLRDINATTKRLVIRNLESEWCLDLEKLNQSLKAPDTQRLSCESTRSFSEETHTSRLSGGGSMSDVTTSNVNNMTRSRTSSSSLLKVPKDHFLIPQVNHSKHHTAPPSNADAEATSDSHLSPILVQDTERLSTLAKLIVPDPSEHYRNSPYSSSSSSSSSSQAIHLPPLSSARSTSPISDVPHRPGSSSSWSYSPARRPAPKPPVTRRKEQLPSHSSPDGAPASSIPAASTSQPNPDSIQNYMLPDPATAYQTGSNSTLIPISGSLSPFSHRFKLTSAEKVTRRAAPSPPLPQSNYTEEVKLPRRRKAPLPPSEQTSRLRSTKSSGSLGLTQNYPATSPTAWKPGQGRVVSLYGGTCHIPTRDTEKNPFGE